MRPQFFVVPITHIDLAWKRGAGEMSEMLEIAVVQILDCLERDPNFKYHLEQAAHFRELATRRPDLIARLKPFLDSGRLEFVGGMASTLETNLPNGECLVRNQQMGLRWVQETWDAKVETGWLIDTFGIHAQMPQILRGFGFKQLMANRFGGSHTRDLFRARGLDGSEITVAGWGTYAAHMKRENLAERFVNGWDDTETVFAQADELSGPGPFMVIPYTENEMLISRRAAQITAERAREQPSQSWQLATPREYFAAVRESGRDLPAVDGDLNPEFTGCFSLRQPIRLRNRRVETKLLEAEKWAALAGTKAFASSFESAGPPEGASSFEGANSLDDAWWQLHFVQFHDVFTGSHPTSVFRDVMATLDRIEGAADAVLARSRAVFAPVSAFEDEARIQVALFNGLPWTRRDAVEVPLPAGFAGVSSVQSADGASLPFEVRDKLVRIGAEVPAVGFSGVTIEKGPAREAKWQEVESAALENDSIRCDFDVSSGLAKLIWKPTGHVLLQDGGGWLRLQSDTGNFQIENPNSAEIAASSGTMRLERLETSDLGQTVRLSGEFPRASWMQDGDYLRYSAEWFLPAHRAEIRLKLALDWHGEAARVRLALPTTLDTSTGIYEIPFGVVARQTYSPRINAKGEWPAHRFVTLESDGHGLALLNTGAAGVEVSGGALLTTLLRAPASVYAGMTLDETSSQHGHHELGFAIVPYAGSWVEAGVAEFAQELNNPIAACRGAARDNASFLQLEPRSVVLSGIQAAQDESGALIVRVYETAGRAADAVIGMPSARRVWCCDLNETCGEEIGVEAGEWSFALKPFEIRSFYVSRES